MTTAPALTAANGSPACPPSQASFVAASVGAKHRKEACIVVGGHCDGGAEANTGKSRSATYPGIKRTPGPAVNVTAIQASVQKGDLPPHGHRRTPCEQYPVTKAPVAVLSADLARCGGSPDGPHSLDAGGGIIAASAARTIVSQKKTGPDALNVWA